MADKRISELNKARIIQLESTLQDECCDICGDVGVVEALITCARCNISCEHSYCMRIMPADYPKNWLCEECEAKGSSLSTPGKLQRDFGRPSELPNDPRQTPVDYKKKIPTGKVKPISAEEVIMLSSGASKPRSPVKLPINPNTVHHNRRFMSVNTPKAGGKPPKSNSHIVTRNPSLLLPRQLRVPIARQQEAESFEGLREKGATQAPLLKRSQKEYIQRGQPAAAIKDNANIERAQNTVRKPPTASTSASSLSNKPIDDSGKKVFSRGTKRVEFAVENRTIASITALPLRIDQPIANLDLAVSSNMIADPRSASASPEVRERLHVPASDASWKGSFNVHLSRENQGEISGHIEAHPSSVVNKKAYDSSKQMPEVLAFELVQRGSLWMDLFENDCPDRRDIALYFFPSNSERCKNYVSLLEHIEKEDLVLRKYMDGRELLIFTSKLLSIDCQRWNGTYFLWGVFRRIKLNQSQDEGDNVQVVDMEIDMIGGEDVDVPRMPPPNTVRGTTYDIPPGFETLYGPTARTSSYSSAEKGGIRARLKAEKPGDSVQTSSRPMVSSSRLNFQNPLKNVKPEFQ